MIHLSRKYLKRDVKKVEIPNNCFGFRFFDITETIIDGERLTGDRKNVSGWYYKGEKMTIEQVKEKYGNGEKYENLKWNMEHNGCESVVKTEFGNFMLLNDNDTVI